MDYGKKAIIISLLVYILFLLAAALVIALLVVLIRLKKISEDVNTLPVFEKNGPTLQAKSVNPQGESKMNGPVPAIPRDEKLSVIDQDDDKTLYSSETVQDDDRTVYSSEDDQEDDRTVCSSADTQDEEKTIYSSDTYPDDDRTVYSTGEKDTLFDDERTVLQADARRTTLKKTSGETSGAVRICLLNRNAGESWNLTLRESNSIIIGRDPACQVFLNDSSVSQYQSVLFLDSTDKPVIENKSRSNITKLNGYDLRSPQVLREDDEIKCGRVVLAAVSVSSL